MLLSVTRMVRVNGVVVALVGAVGWLEGAVTEVMGSAGELDGRVKDLEEEVGELIVEGKEAEADRKNIAGKVKGVEGEIERLEIEAKKAVEEMKGLAEETKVKGEGVAAVAGLLKEQVENMVELMKGMEGRIAELEMKEVTRGGEAEEMEEEERWFLEEVARLQREFIDGQSSKVSDEQLKSLRGKWRVEAFNQLERRREDKGFFRKKG